MQKKRYAQRKKLEKKTDPTGELEYSPIPGTDTPYEEPNPADRSLESGARITGNALGVASSVAAAAPLDSGSALGLELESIAAPADPGPGIEEPPDFTGEVQRYQSFLRLKTSLAT